MWNVWHPWKFFFTIFLLISLTIFGVEMPRHLEISAEKMIVSIDFFGKFYWRETRKEVLTFLLESWAKKLPSPKSNFMRNSLTSDTLIHAFMKAFYLNHNTDKKFYPQSVTIIKFLINFSLSSISEIAMKSKNKTNT